MPPTDNEMRCIQHKASVEAALNPTDPPLTMDDLSPIQQAVASLGEAPGQLQPISWLNAAHYQGLINQNMVNSTLARRVEARRYVTQQG